MHKVFLQRLATFFLLLLLPIGCNLLFLYRSGELLAIEEIFELQLQDSRYLYGTALHADTKQYKLAGYSKVQPQVVVLGSSTSMQMAGMFFRQPFYNLGGAMDSISDGELVVDRMLNGHRPNHILLGLDFWWFNSQFKQAKYGLNIDQEKARLASLRPLLEPFKWIRDGKVSLKEYFNIILSPDPFLLGIAAQKRQTGFLEDGSYVYTSTIVGEEEGGDIQFEGTLRRMQEERSRFEQGEYANDTHISHFIALVRRLRENGVDVTVYMPPLAPTVYDELMRRIGDYKYIADIKDRLKGDGIEILDLQNPYLLQSGACEFVDGFHGGAITNARVLLAIDQWRVSQSLPALGRTDLLHALISKNSGHAMLRERTVVPGQEVDFLKIGCDKKIPGE